MSLRIFVVENDIDSRKMLTVLLRALGHEVVAASSLAEAVAEIPGAACDVLLSDIGLPDGSGWDLHAALRNAQAVSPTYAIAMSGYGLREDVERSKAAGYRHHLVKPMDIDRLERMLLEASQEIGARPPA